MMVIRTFKVSELNNYIAKTIHSNPLFFNVSVEGEVFNFKKSSYGYLFFSLKDETSKINCLLNEEHYDETFEDGKRVIVKGKLHIYEKNGTYSILVRQVTLSGTGKSFEEYLRLKEELNSLGYFDSKYKKKLPVFPKGVGVITSATGSVINDVIHVIERRYPLTHIFLYPTKVQGEYVHKDLIKGLDYFDNHQNIDVIIIARGGGSYDELSVFNNRELAFKIFHCNTPIISAIGHENDYLISDMVADLRAPTPSAAAEMCVPDISVIHENLNQSFKSLVNSIKSKQFTYVSLLDHLFQRLQLLNPISRLYLQKDRLETLHRELSLNIHRRIDMMRTRSDFLFIQLDDMNPINILKRGYASVEKDGRVITDIRLLNTGDQIQIRLNNGYIVSEVTKIIDTEALNYEKK